MAKRTFVSLAEKCPELVSEWHPTKNGDLKPTDISYGSACKVWWKCQKGHEWDATPNHRSRGRGCRFCAEEQRSQTKRKNIVAKRGSLADNNPDLAREWHPTKNGSLTPYDISAHSAERVWWQCLKDKTHVWDAPISSRNAGNGCPVCSGYRLVVGVNDLATVRPDLAAQWHPTKNGDIKPSDVIAGTDQKVWWQCEKGHPWQARISNRIHGNNCPICIGKKVLVGYNDLATVRPSLAAEWHKTKNGTLTASDVTLWSNKKVWWECNKKHEWETPVSNRSRGRGCPVCSGEIKTSFPEQAIFFYLRQISEAHNRYMIAPRTEIDIYLPQYKVGIEYDGAYYHAGETSRQREVRKQEKLDELGIKLIRVRELSGQTGDNTIYAKPGANDIELTVTIKELLLLLSSITQTSFNVDVDIMRDRNKIYEQYIQSEKENSLSFVNPDLAKEWHPTKNGKLTPEHVSAYANRMAWWMCAARHEWQAAINSRQKGAGCAYCSGYKAIIGVNDLATVNPKLASQWHPTKNENRKPSDFLPKSNIKAWWICERGHEWQSSICDRTEGGGCPICSGHKVLAGYNDLATLNPELAKEWHPTKNGKLTPQDVTCGSDKRVWWLGKCTHAWEAVISSRIYGYGCPYCAGQKVITGYNDLATINPELAKEWHPTKNGDIKSTDVMPGSHHKAWWLGKCGHEWKAVISSRNAGRGCPYCSSTKVLVGFNDLATSNPKLASEWHPTKNGTLSPKDVMPGSNKKVWWLCDRGHEWQNTIATRNSGNGCPYCANQMILKGYNDLATTNPELAKEWHPTKNGELTPSDVMAGSNKKAWWLCESGHEWYAYISSRNKGHGCAECYRNRRKQKNSR